MAYVFCININAGHTLEKYPFYIVTTKEAVDSNKDIPILCPSTTVLFLGHAVVLTDVFRNITIRIAHNHAWLDIKLI